MSCNSIQLLDNFAFESLSIPLHTLIITDASVKNNIVTSISHTHIHNRPVIKTLDHVVNVISTEAELFAIRYGINQATNHNNISKIIIITDSIHIAKKIFDLLFHPYQIHTAAILNELLIFLLHHQKNSIKFWECPSHSNWVLHKAVDKETKSFNPLLLLSYKLSWDFNKKNECDDIANKWKMIFQVSDLKRKQFLNLLNSDSNILEPFYIKGRPWLKFFGYSNSLCARAMRAITNHAPTGKYRLRFFPREEFSCLCGFYPIKIRWHFLYECKRFNKYWNLRKDLISHFVMFLESNPGAFVFQNLNNFLATSRSLVNFCITFHSPFFFLLFFISYLSSFTLHVVPSILYIVMT